MLNRDEIKINKILRRVSSILSILLIFLIVWIKNLYTDIYFIEMENSNIDRELIGIQKECDMKERKIDSLIGIINYKDIIEIKKPTKIIIEKNTTDTIKYLKEDTISIEMTKF
jgi:hypothetical protein